MIFFAVPSYDNDGDRGPVAKHEMKDTPRQLGCGARTHDVLRAAGVCVRT